MSTASLIVGVAAAAAGEGEAMVAGLAGLVAGSMPMAPREYVSVSSHSDLESADRAQERTELARHPDAKLSEPAAIYRERGLSLALAVEVALSLTRHDALGAPVRDELGWAELTRICPLQAAITSATTFAAGASLPLAAAGLFPLERIPAGLGGWR